MQRRQSVLAVAYRITTAWPAIVLSRILLLTGPQRIERQLWKWGRGVPLLSLVATAVLWIAVIWRGVLYPITDGSNLSHSWGGPTLAGAWLVHLAIALAALFAISLILAMFESRRMVTQHV